MKREYQGCAITPATRRVRAPSGDAVRRRTQSANYRERGETMMTDRYDVAILGSGIGGSMLACILAKHGVRTLLLEGATHPRFTIGESLIPETGIPLRILAEKYGVPEIGWIGSFHALRDNVSSNCGVKRSFTFMYHREGEAHRADATTQ